MRTSAMAGQGGEVGGMRSSFGGPGTPPNSAGGVVGDSQRDSYPVSRYAVFHRLDLLVYLGNQGCVIRCTCLVCWIPKEF